MADGQRGVAVIPQVHAAQGIPPAVVARPADQQGIPPEARHALPQRGHQLCFTGAVVIDAVSGLVTGALAADLIQQAVLVDDGRQQIGVLSRPGLKHRLAVHQDGAVLPGDLPVPHAELLGGVEFLCGKLHLPVRRHLPDLLSVIIADGLGVIPGELVLSPVEGHLQPGQLPPGTIIIEYGPGLISRPAQQRGGAALQRRQAERFLQIGDGRRQLHGGHCPLRLRRGGGSRVIRRFGGLRCLWAFRGLRRFRHTGCLRGLGRSGLRRGRIFLPGRRGRLGFAAGGAQKQGADHQTGKPFFHGVSSFSKQAVPFNR